MWTKQGDVMGRKRESEKIEAGHHHTSLLLLFYSCCFEDELVGKPFFSILSTLLFLYCLIIPITHKHKNNNASSSHNMIIRRHPGTICCIQ